MKNLIKTLALLLLLPSLVLADRNIYTGEATAAERRIPIYLVDATDGVTPETGVAIAGSECRITKNGVSPADCAGTVVEAEDGLYYYQASTGDIDTVGYITVEIADSAARKFVATANVVAYDPTTTNLNVNVVSINTDAIQEGDFSARDTAQSATSSTLRLAASETFADDELNRNTAVHIVSATTGAGQTRAVCDYASATDTATLCENWTTTPTGTITYSLIAQAHADALLPTTYGLTLDVTAGGNAGIDWANVANPTTVLDLSNTTIDAASSSDPTITTGTAQSITTSPPGMRLAAASAYASNTLNDHVAIMILTSSGNTAAEGQVMCVKKNTLTNDVVEFTRGYQSTPSGTVTYAIIPAPNCNAANWPKSR